MLKMKLEKYTKNGGKLIATGESGLNLAGTELERRESLFSTGNERVSF